MIDAGAFAILGLAQLDATSSDGAIRALAQVLAREGHVKATVEGAAPQRERRSPTGLPFPGLAVALPHAEPEHVVSPAIAIASLARPVRFRQMGSPATALEVSLVVMPALTAKEQAAAGLSRLIELLQDDALRAELVAAASPEAMRDILARRWKA
jgi:PTS system galactitol-specific IIA component